MMKFLKEYIKSMRLYYSFVTGIAGWIGVAYYELLANHHVERTIEVLPSQEKKIVILIMLFLGWGVNQIINDYLGLKEDRINAPDRPMVTGELDANKALFVSLAILSTSIVMTWFYLQPIAIIFIIAGAVLNVIYEFAKGHGIFGNIVFGLMITMATFFGFYACGPTQASFLAPHRLAALILIWIINGLMTFYTYFKDYEGDKAAGKNTLVVKYGLDNARSMAIFATFLPTIAFFIFKALDMWAVKINSTFIMLGCLTMFMQVWTGLLYYRSPTGTATYASLKTNFRACVCGEATIIAFFNPDLALWLFIMSYMFVEFLFELHPNAKS
ncbi:MAG: UbiA family prenyltransferase [Candidatus Omnitrophica bacterium]|nr:UbiA family prenyltransferase [Candidatus Omnitrophota bacterium]